MTDNEQQKGFLCKISKVSRELLVVGIYTIGFSIDDVNLEWVPPDEWRL